MIHKLLLLIISIIHAIIVAFIIVVPFTNITVLLLLYVIIVPFIILHWILNNNQCSLTLVERKLRKKIYGNYSPSDCITCRLIEPIYDFRKKHKQFTTLIYAATIILFLIAVLKLVNKFQSGQIKNFMDLFSY